MSSQSDSTSVCEAPSPATDLTHDQADELDRVVRAIDALPANQQEVVRLKFQEGMSYKEIAGMLEAPIGTVMSRLSRGKAQLRAALARKEAGTRAKVVPFQNPDTRKLS